MSGSKSLAAVGLEVGFRDITRRMQSQMEKRAEIDNGSMMRLAYVEGFHHSGLCIWDRQPNKLSPWTLGAR